MISAGARQKLKQLAVDGLMSLIFLVLTGFSLWLLYIYFLRGPIDIETRGFVSHTIRTEEIQPVQVEKYRLDHFHNLDDVVLAGIQSHSLCVTCHTDYPHSKDNKTRAFFNAHAWFMACEVCHMKSQNNEQLSYRWLQPDNGKALTSLDGQPGVYGGLIVPLKVDNGIEKRLDVLSGDDQVYIEEFIRLQKILNEYQIDLAQKRIHKSLSKEAVSCGQCHTEKSILNFDQLLYSRRRASHLRSLDMTVMTNNHSEFYIPNLSGKTKNEL